MAPKTQKHPWRDLNYIKRKKKKLKTEEKLLKKLKQEEENEEEKCEPNQAIPAIVSESTEKLGPPTISLAVPASIMDLCQNTEIKGHRALQIARAACIYRVDEVNTYPVVTVIFSSF